MVKGIGVDTVDMNEISRLIKRSNQAFLNRTFTKKEIEISRTVPDQMAYLAARFAAKEAVFKAIAHLTKEKSFDFRMVETLNEEDGSPVVSMDETMRQITKTAGINSILISLTTEGCYATAFVVVQG